MSLHDILGFSWRRPDLPQQKPKFIKEVVFQYMVELVTFVFDAAALEGNPMTLTEVGTLGQGGATPGHSQADREQVQNLYAASNELTTMVQKGQFQLDKPTSCRLHDLVAREEALEWGHFRGEGDEVSWTPEVPLDGCCVHTPPPTVRGAPELNRQFQDGASALESEVEDPRERAMVWFLFGARQQFYFDGNKRTARFMMNGILMSHGFDAISVPTGRAEEFDQEMIAFYIGGDATQMMAFLFDCQTGN